MSKFKGKDFSGQRVKLDGNSYEDCKFNDATLTYAGGAPPELIRCDCSGAAIGFVGSAENTALFLKAMSQDPALSGFVRQLFAAAPPIPSRG
jgi:hypothetical protein